MKGLKVTGVALAIVVVAMAFDHQHGRTVTLRWDYDYTNYPPCPVSGSKPSEKPCLAGFNVFFLRGPEVRAEQQFVSNRLDPGGKLIEKGISAVLHVQTYGNLEFCVTSVAKNDRGLTAESLPTCSKRWVLPFGVGRD